MILKIRKRETANSDGPQLRKTKHVYEVVDHPEFVICEKFVEDFLHMQGGLGDILEFTVLPRLGYLGPMDTDRLLAELAHRIKS